MAVHQIWMHLPTGKLYAIRLADGQRLEAMGPIKSKQQEGLLRGGWPNDKRLADQIARRTGEYHVVNSGNLAPAPYDDWEADQFKAEDNDGPNYARDYHKMHHD